MATVYEVKLEVVSRFLAYPARDMEKIIGDLVKGYVDRETGLTLQVSSVEARKKA